MQEKTAIEEAIEVIGGQSKLADAIGCTKSQVNHWVPTPSKAEPDPIPIYRCIAIERVTGVSRKKLNPAINWDLFSIEPAKRTRRATKSKAEAA